MLYRPCAYRTTTIHLSIDSATLIFLAKCIEVHLRAWMWASFLYRPRQPSYWYSAYVQPGALSYSSNGERMGTSLTPISSLLCIWKHSPSSSRGQIKTSKLLLWCQNQSRISYCLPRCVSRMHTYIPFHPGFLSPALHLVYNRTRVSWTLRFLSGVFSSATTV